jgi:SNF2 family DNA or RNA helicase
VYLINYEQFKILSAKTKGRIDAKIQCLVIDESAKCKNFKAQITKEIIKYRNSIKYKLCLSGIPAPNSIDEYFSQMCFINSDLLGENFYRFRNTFFFSYGYGGYQYKPNAGAQEAILDIVSRQSFSIRKEDCLSLPEKTFETRDVYMDEVQRRAYDEMKRENIMEFQGHTTLGANELAKICKLREITGGFCINTQGMPIKISNTKISVLKELSEEIPNDKPIIVWIQYHWECDEIKRELGDSAVILTGTITQKEKLESIKNFQEGKKRFLIAHPKSGGHGLNLQICSYVIWYSMSYSYEEYAQACDRNYRIGTKQKVTYFHLIAKDTIDEVIYNAISKKKNLSELCLNMLKGKNA